MYGAVWGTAEMQALQQDLLGQSLGSWRAPEFSGCCRSSTTQQLRLQNLESFPGPLGRVDPSTTQAGTAWESQQLNSLKIHICLAEFAPRLSLITWRGWLPSLIMLTCSAHVDMVVWWACSASAFGKCFRFLCWNGTFVCRYCTLESAVKFPASAATWQTAL